MNKKSSPNKHDWITEGRSKDFDPCNKSQEDDEGSATVRNALKSLGFGLDGSMDSLISSGTQNAKNNNNNNNSGGMQYSGLGYNLRL